MFDEDRLGRFSEDRFRAEVKRFGTSQRIPAYIIHGLSDNTRVMLEIERVTCDLAVRLYHDVYSLGEATKRIEFEASFQVPETWVDALKERFKRWIPRFVLRKWPIHWKRLEKRETVEVDARALLPGIPVRNRNGIDVVFALQTRMI